MFSAKSPFNNKILLKNLFTWLIWKIVCHKSLAFSSHSVSVNNVAQLHNARVKVNKLIIVNNRLYVSSVSIAADTSCLVRCFARGRFFISQVIVSVRLSINDKQQINSRLCTIISLHLGRTVKTVCLRTCKSVIGHKIMSICHTVIKVYKWD